MKRRARHLKSTKSVSQGRIGQINQRELIWCLRLIGQIEDGTFIPNFEAQIARGLCGTQHVTKPCRIQTRLVLSFLEAHGILVRYKTRQGVFWDIKK